MLSGSSRHLTRTLTLYNAPARSSMKLEICFTLFCSLLKQGSALCVVNKLASWALFLEAPLFQLDSDAHTQ